MQLILLAPDLHFLELGEIAQAQVEDCFGLDVGQLETLHQHRLWLVFLANDRDDLVDIQIGDQQTIENVQAIVNDLQAMIETLRDRFLAELQPFLEHLDQIEHARPAVQADDIHVDAHRALK